MTYGAYRNTVTYACVGGCKATRSGMGKNLPFFFPMYCMRAAFDSLWGLQYMPPCGGDL